jgi:hypothetical protein
MQALEWRIIPHQDATGFIPAEIELPVSQPLDGRHGLLDRLCRIERTKRPLRWVVWPKAD